MNLNPTLYYLVNRINPGVVLTILDNNKPGFSTYDIGVGTINKDLDDYQLFYPFKRRFAGGFLTTFCTLKNVCMVRDNNIIQGSTRLARNLTYSRNSSKWIHLLLNGPQELLRFAVGSQCLTLSDAESSDVLYGTSTKMEVCSDPRDQASLELLARQSFRMISADKGKSKMGIPRAPNVSISLDALEKETEYVFSRLK